MILEVLAVKFCGCSHDSVYILWFVMGLGNITREGRKYVATAVDLSLHTLGKCLQQTYSIGLGVHS
jgi:hypothetical protein